MSEKFYRSPVDKLVELSNFSGKKVAEEMGVPYNRMVALRRAKKITYEDIRLCEEAIESLERKATNQPSKKEESILSEYGELVTFLCMHPQKDFSDMGEVMIKIMSTRNMVESLSHQLKQTAIDFEDLHREMMVISFKMIMSNNKLPDNLPPYDDIKVTH